MAQLNINGTWGSETDYPENFDEQLFLIMNNLCGNKQRFMCNEIYHENKDKHNPIQIPDGYRSRKERIKILKSAFNVKIKDVKPHGIPTELVELFESNGIVQIKDFIALNERGLQFLLEDQTKDVQDLVRGLHKRMVDILCGA